MKKNTSQRSNEWVWKWRAITDGMFARESLSIFTNIFVYDLFLWFFFRWVIKYHSTPSSSSSVVWWQLYTGMQFFKCLFILSKIRKCIFINVVGEHIAHSVCLFMEFLPICLFIFLASLLLSLKKMWWQIFFHWNLKLTVKLLFLSQQQRAMTHYGFSTCECE